MQRLRLTLFLICISMISSAAAQDVEVDLELVLMVDVSRSMTENELEIQRRGYAEALRSEAVYAATRTGLLQRIALTYVEWAGQQEVVVDWRLIETREDLLRFADSLTTRYDPNFRRTSISEALLFGAKHMDANLFTGLRRVIDISGDGPNNQGRAVLAARNTVLDQGITINGLPLLTHEGLGQDWHLEDLDVYYRSCVIGGLGAFAIPVYDWSDFAEAVRRKLVLEIADVALAPEIIPAQALVRDPTDCLIGEKIWQNRANQWNGP